MYLNKGRSWVDVQEIIAGLMESIHICVCECVTQNAALGAQLTCLCKELCNNTLSLLLHITQDHRAFSKISCWKNLREKNKSDNFDNLGMDKY